MPWKPKSICNYPGCQVLTRDRYCQKHKKEIIRTQNDRGSKMYTYQWRKASKEFLKKHPLCIHCDREGRLTPATEVDHIKPHRGDKKLFWNKKNWQPLCKSCHSKKTAEEDGGFGNNPNPARGQGVSISTEVPKRQRARVFCEKSRKFKGGYIPNIVRNI